MPGLAHAISPHVRGLHPCGQPQKGASSCTQLPDVERRVPAISPSRVQVAIRAGYMTRPSFQPSLSPSPGPAQGGLDADTADSPEARPRPTGCAPAPNSSAVARLSRRCSARQLAYLPRAP